MATIKVKVQPPSLPNFLRLGESIDSPPQIDVADLTDQELQEVGREWTERLIEHARQRRRVQRALK